MIIVICVYLFVLKITLINIFLIRVSINTEVIHYIYDNKIFHIMSYEAGSKECRHLIEAKDSLLSAMESLSNINSTDVLQIQIKQIYNKLEIMHDNRKKIESTTNYL